MAKKEKLKRNSSYYIYINNHGGFFSFCTQRDVLKASLIMVLT